jgi:hypothetical protein
MDIQAVKLEIMQLLLNTQKERVLTKIKDVFDQEEETIDHAKKGKPMTIESYIKDIDEARKQALTGQCISQEELEKQSQNW